jgi:predicted DNA-binding transcriptional regulator AlpA
VNGALQSPDGHVVDKAAKLVRIADICRDGGFSYWTWRRWVRCGKAPQPVANMPGFPRWKASDVAQFLDGRKGRHFFGGAR